MFKFFKLSIFSQGRGVQTLSECPNFLRPYHPGEGGGDHRSCEQCTRFRSSFILLSEITWQTAWAWPLLRTSSVFTNSSLASETTGTRRTWPPANASSMSARPQGKIYYCRLVPLSLWETFHNKTSGKIFYNKIFHNKHCRKLFLITCLGGSLPQEAHWETLTNHWLMFR